MMTATATKERPILFSGPMVRAILDGSKTQTRRLVKGPQDAARFVHGVSGGPGHWWHYFPDPRGSAVNIPCPYGKPGDRLWVKEDMYYTGNLKQIESVRFCYGADCTDLKLTARVNKRLFAQHMSSRWSRITLEITDVRVERLQEISEADALAEGLWKKDHKGDFAYGYGGGNATGHGSPTGAFQALWDSINAKTHPWESNPWVWVVSFKRVEGDQS